MGKLFSGKRINQRDAFRIFIAGLLPVLIFLSLDFPINVDEPLHYDHAKDVVQWYITHGENTACLETPWTNLKYYGQSVDNLTALINTLFSIENEYRVRHITGAIFAWFFLLFTGLLAFEITGRYRTAIIAVAALLLIPPVMGQFCNNLKDITFGAGYVFSIWAMIKVFQSLPRAQWKYILFLALGIAFLNSVRIGGLITYPYFFLFGATWLLFQNKFQIFNAESRLNLYRLIAQVGVIVFAGYFLGLLFWPYGLIKPFSNPFESLSVMEDYSIHIRQIFEGKWYWSKSLPIYYLEKWLLISLPEFILFGLILYALHFFMNARRITFRELMVVFTLLFPLVYVVLIRSNLYSGWRQMYFVAGHIAVLFAIGTESIIAITIRRRTAAIAVAAITVILAALPAVHYIRTPKTSYIYFNQLSGGNKQAWSNYEYDYYWHGMKKAATWFNENIAEGDTVVDVASNFKVSLYFKDRKDIEFRYVHYDNRSEVPWDYGIFGVNYIHPDQLKKDMWKPFGIVKIFSDAYGNPLALIIHRENSKDIEGISYFRSGKYVKAINYLEQAIQQDQNNFVLYEYLAECYYSIGDKEGCKNFVENTKKLHPWSEKILMIDAQLEFDNGNYESALKKCLNIVENNHKYYNIVPLLISCYEKTGNSEMAEYYKEQLKAKELNN